MGVITTLNSHFYEKDALTLAAFTAISASTSKYPSSVICCIIKYLGILLVIPLSQILTISSSSIHEIRMWQHELLMLCSVLMVLFPVAKSSVETICSYFTGVHLLLHLGHSIKISVGHWFLNKFATSLCLALSNNLLYDRLYERS